MQCSRCKQGNLFPGIVSVTMERGTSSIIFNGVPANVCCDCGEYWLSEDIAAELLEMANEPGRNKDAVEVVWISADYGSTESL